MKRLFIGAALAGAALLLPTTDAWAHGGQYRGGVGEIPPALRDAEDPTPEPPVCEPGDGPTTDHGDPDSPQTGPVTAPTPDTPPVATGPGSSRDVGPKTRRRKSSTGFETWNFWYHFNNGRVENLKRSLYTRVHSRNPLFEIGGSDTSNRSDSLHAIDALVRTDVVDALKWAMNKKNVPHSDARSAAFIGMGKVATTPAHVELLSKGFDADETEIVKESTALAYGVLRRANPARQFASSDLSKIRDRLFEVFENEKDFGTRTRSFAIMSIGLLGDQPFVR